MFPLADDHPLTPTVPFCAYAATLNTSPHFIGHFEIDHTLQRCSLTVEAQHIAIFVYFPLPSEISNRFIYNPPFSKDPLRATIRADTSHISLPFCIPFA